MAGRSDVEAGRAYVSLFLKDNGFVKGLDAAGRKMQSIGRGVAIIGGAISGFGSAITAPFLAMAKEFADTGSALNDMSARTGMSASKLSELKYAAEQTGTSLESVEKALRFMAKEGKNVNTFDQVAARIAAIEDPSKRAEAAMKAWGKSGTALLPMITDLRALQEEARNAGLVMSDEAASRADALGDAFDKLLAIMKAVRLTIGDAVSGTIREAIGYITNIAISVGRWVAANQTLFVTVFKIGVGLTAAGVAITAFGVALYGVGTALTMFAGLIGTAAAVVSSLVSPVALVVAGLVGLTYWFLTSTNAGQSMVQSLVGWFGTLAQVARDTFGGIADAIAAGDMSLAMKVAMAGVKLAWLEATNWLRTKWTEFKDFYIRTTTEAVFGALRWWIHLKTELFSLWDSYSTQAQSVGEKIGHWLTRSSDPETAREQDAVHNQALKNIQSQGAAKQRENAANSANELAALDASAKAANDARTATNNADVTAQKNALDKAKAELSALKSKATAARKDAELSSGPGFKPGQLPMGGEALKSSVFGTFSAAAAMAGGGTAETKTVQELREQKKIQQDLLKETQAHRAALKQMGLA